MREVPEDVDLTTATASMSTFPTSSAYSAPSLPLPAAGGDGITAESSPAAGGIGTHPHQEEWMHAARLASVFSVSLALIGILGNLLTIVALARNQKLSRHATTIFVINLSCSDLIFCSFNLPLTATKYIGDGHWQLGTTVCQLYPFFFYGNVGVSLLSMVCITLNRYILIVHNNKYDTIYQRKYILLMILSIWLISFLMLLPPLLGIWGRLGHNDDTLSCTVLEDENGNSPKKFLFVLGFAVPCLAIVVCYSAIYWLVRKSSRRLRLSSSYNNRCSSQSPSRCVTTTSVILSENNNRNALASPSPMAATSQHQVEQSETETDEATTKPKKPPIFQSVLKVGERRGRQDGVVERRCGRKRKPPGGVSEDMKLTRMMLIIFCTFLICFLPLTVMNAAVEDNKMPLLHTIASICAWLSAVVNPFIYALMNRRYRQAYTRLLSPFKKQLVRKWWLSTTTSNHGNQAGRGSQNGAHRASGAVVGDAGSNRREIEWSGRCDEGERGRRCGKDVHVTSVGSGSELGSGGRSSSNSTSHTDCTKIAETNIS